MQNVRSISMHLKKNALPAVEFYREASIVFIDVNSIHGVHDHRAKEIHAVLLCAMKLLRKCDDCELRLEACADEEMFCVFVKLEQQLVATLAETGYQLKIF